MNTIYIDNFQVDYSIYFLTHGILYFIVFISLFSLMKKYGKKLTVVKNKIKEVNENIKEIREFVKIDEEEDEDEEDEDEEGEDEEEEEEEEVSEENENEEEVSEENENEEEVSEENENEEEVSEEVSEENEKEIEISYPFSSPKSVLDNLQIVEPPINKGHPMLNLLTPFINSIIEKSPLSDLEKKETKTMVNISNEMNASQLKNYIQDFQDSLDDIKENLSEDDKKSLQYFESIFN